MARQRNGTRERILAVALALFAERGYAKTSLREIAERLDITKAALYYHFPSKAALLRELVHPLLDDVGALLDEAERSEDAGPRRVLADYFDVIARHRAVFLLLVNDAGTLAQLDVMPAIFAWRERMQTLLVGPDADPVAATRATVAVGGMQDAAIILDVPQTAEVRAAAIDAAHRALGT